MLIPIGDGDGEGLAFANNYGWLSGSTCCVVATRDAAKKLEAANEHDMAIVKNRDPKTSGAFPKKVVAKAVVLGRVGRDVYVCDDY